MLLLEHYSLLDELGNFLLKLYFSILVCPFLRCISNSIQVKFKTHPTHMPSLYFKLNFYGLIFNVYLPLKVINIS